MFERHIWRQDIVTPFVVTYASRYILRLQNHKIYKNKKRTGDTDSYIRQCDLRGIFDEKRLDEKF